MDATIRPARTNELDAVMAMYEWLFAEPGYVPPAWDEGKAGQRLEEAVGALTSIVLVAEAAGGALVGLCCAYLDINSIRFGQRCWVEDLAVHPEHRSAGVGKALIDAAKEWARERGATHFELDTGIARTDAQRFYEREGPVGKGYSYTWAL